MRELLLVGRLRVSGESCESYQNWSVDHKSGWIMIVFHHLLRVATTCIVLPHISVSNKFPCWDCCWYRDRTRDGEVSVSQGEPKLYDLHHLCVCKEINNSMDVGQLGLNHVNLCWRRFCVCLEILFSHAVHCQDFVLCFRCKCRLDFVNLDWNHTNGPWVDYDKLQLPRCKVVWERSNINEIHQYLIWVK